MKNSAFRLFIPGIVAVMFLSACSFGLIPASARNSAATVSLKLGSLDSPENATARAIAQGSGCLYLRTVGGPTGDSGPFYGPYQVSSGGTFSTTDLPAGSYKGINLLYSANKLDETKTFSYNGGTYTFRQLMQQSDEALEAMMDENSSFDGEALANFFDGEVSTGAIGKVTLTEGATTALSATLVPACGEKYWVSFANAAGVSLPATSTTVRKFYALWGLDAASGSTITCTATPGASGTATIGTVALYGLDGKLLSSNSSVGTITAAKTFTATANGDTEVYLYIEYRASDLTLTFDTVASSSLSCSFAGNSDWMSKKLFIEVFDTSLLSGASSTSLAGYMGCGVITLDSSGNGMGVIYDAVTGKAMAPLAGHTYVYKAVFDQNNRYASYASADSLISAGILSAMTANYGDYVASTEVGFLAKSGENSIALNIESFTMETTATLFVASKSFGTASGLDSLNPCTLGDLNEILSMYSNAAMIAIELTENADLSEQLNLTGPNITLTSYNQGGYTISYKSAAACLNVTANSFTMTNVTLDGTGVTLTNSALLIGSTQATLGSGSVIQNMTSNENPAGAALGIVSNATVTMLGAIIKNCKATNTSGGGGGVYITAGSLIMQAGSSIIGCDSGCHGGGVYMLSSCSMTMESGSSIKGCTATSRGGGIYAETGVMMLDFKTGAAITGNTAGSLGGGVFSATFEPADKSMITGNTPSDFDLGS